jgi:hypothetical protein
MNTKRADQLERDDVVIVDFETAAGIPMKVAHVHPNPAQPTWITLVLLFPDRSSYLTTRHEDYEFELFMPDPDPEEQPEEDEKQ